MRLISRSNLRLHLIATAAFVCVSGPALTADADELLPTTIEIMLEADDADSRGWQLGLLHPFTDKTWLALGAGRVSSDSDGLDTDNLNLSAVVDHQFETLGATLGVGYWGDDALSTVDVFGSVYWQGKRWRFDAELEYRRVEAELIVTAPSGMTRRFARDFNGRGLGVRVSVAASESITLFAHGRNYDYSEDLDFSPLLTRVLVSTLNLDSALLNSVLGAGIDAELGPGTLTLTFERYDSALIELETDSLAALYALPITDKVDLQLGAGRSDTEILGDTRYGQLGLRWYF